MAADHEPASTRRHRPRSATVFIAAFVAGAVAAVGINRALDVHLAQSKPQVECEPIFVALRSLPQGVPVTVWDVALRDWPKAMMPVAAVRVNDSFAGCLLKHPLREGQPLLSVQLLAPAIPTPTPGPEPVNPDSQEEVFVPPVPATAASAATVEIQSAPVVTADVVASKPAATIEPPPELLATIEPEPDRVHEPVVGDQPAIETGDSTPDDCVAIEGSRNDLPAGLAGAPIAEEPVAVVNDHPATDADATSEASLPEQIATVPAPEATPFEPQTALRESSTSLQPTLAAIRQEPTPVAMPPAALPVGALAPITISPQMLGSSADAPYPMDLPSRATSDIASLPSVMSRNEESMRSDATASTDSSIRYLVVPERIAQQADTSFTTPPAPTVGSLAAEQPSPASQPRASSQPPISQQPKAQQTGSARAPSRNQPRTAGGSRGQATAKQPARDQERPSADRASAESRTWGSMFPNVSAGLDAITNWRSRDREVVADERPEAKPPRR